MDTIREIFGLSREFADQCYDFLTPVSSVTGKAYSLITGVIVRKVFLLKKTNKRVILFLPPVSGGSF